MSLRASTSIPRACSGDMYLAVPSTIPGSLVEDVMADAASTNCLSDPPLAQLGDSEIEDFNNSVGSNNHILGLDVAMNNSAGMSRRQSAGNLYGNVNRGIQLQPAARPFSGEGSRPR